MVALIFSVIPPVASQLPAHALIHLLPLFRVFPHGHNCPPPSSRREEQVRQKVWTNFGEALKQRSYVYQLDLSRQRLETLPSEIGRLNKVEICNLSENDLRETSIPEEFYDLERLRELDISYNHFKVLPSSICTFLDLQKINIAGTLQMVLI